MEATILRVDDVPTNLQLLVRFLSDTGYRILVAEDGDGGSRSNCARKTGSHPARRNDARDEMDLRPAGGSKLIRESERHACPLPHGTVRVLR